MSTENPIEQVCPSLLADGVAANFTGTWQSWGKVDPNSISTSQEEIYTMFERARLTFKPLVAQSQYLNPITGQMSAVENEYHILRGDDGTWIGRGRKQLADSMSVGGHYEVLEMLIGVLANGSLPCRVISFHNGARALIQLLIPEEHVILGRSHKTFHTIYNAMDGSSNAKVGYSDYCPVCENTFLACKRDLESGLTARHTGDMSKKLEKIRKTILKVDDSIKNYYTTLQSFASKSADSQVLSDFLKYLIPETEPEPGKKKSSRSDNRRAELASSVATSLMERNGSEITFYDLLQGVTRITSSRSAEYSLFGAGAQMNEQAMSWLSTSIK